MQVPLQSWKAHIHQQQGIQQQQQQWPQKEQWLCSVFEAGA